MLKNNIYIGVSGGPDSMALLNYLINKYKKKNIIVLHVNYNFRQESKQEFEMVRFFCLEKSINFKFLNVTSKLIETYKENNKQKLARDIRYDFFLDSTKEEKNPIIYIGHHKDDFIETALMQESRSNDYFYYGIKKKSNYKNITILRPFLKYWKDELIEFCHNNNISFSVDETNSKPIYERNKIRILLSEKNKQEKEKINSYFKKINSSNEKRNKLVNSIFNKWNNNNFSWDFYNTLREKYDEKVILNLIYLYLLSINLDVNINKNKINSIKEFLLNYSKNKSFRIKENTKLVLIDRTLKLVVN